MLPRRTLRATSRTAKKPANSLVNPWVSRMNSSVNQISPVGHYARNAAARDHLFRSSGFASRPGPAASGAEYAVKPHLRARWKAWAPAGGERQKSNCVKGVIGHSPSALAVVPWPGRKAAVNAVCTRAHSFIKNLGLTPKL